MYNNRDSQTSTKFTVTTTVSEHNTVRTVFIGHHLGLDST